MKTLVIAEKASQARDIRAAVGDRHGPILPAEGHLLRLAEPEEVDPGLEALVLRPAQARRPLPDQAGPRRQQAAKLRPSARR